MIGDRALHNEGNAAEACDGRWRVEDRMMQIQVNTDSNVSGREKLADEIAVTLEARLARFGDYLTRVEVHLADESAARTTGADKRCVIEARPAGRQPVAVTSHADTVDEAVTSAVRKLATVLERELGRRGDNKGSPSIRTGAGEDDAAVTPNEHDEGAAERCTEPGPSEE